MLWNRRFASQVFYASVLRRGFYQKRLGSWRKLINTYFNEMVPFLSSNSCVIHSCHISSSPRGSFRFEIFFVSRRESVAFSRTFQSTTSTFRPSKIDCLTTSDGFKFGFLEETVPQRREGELFFSLGKYAYQRGRYEPHIRGAGIPFSNWTLLALPCCCLKEHFEFSHS